MFWVPICKKFGNGTHIRNIGGAKKNQCAVPPRLITLIGFCRLRGCQSHHRPHSHKKTSGALSKNRTCDSSLPRTCFTTRLLGQRLPANYKYHTPKIKDKKHPAKFAGFRSTNIHNYSIQQLTAFLTQCFNRDIFPRLRRFFHPCFSERRAAQQPQRACFLF